MDPFGVSVLRILKCNDSKTPCHSNLSNLVMEISCKRSMALKRVDPMVHGILGLFLSTTAHIGISQFVWARFSSPLVSRIPKCQPAATCPSDGWRQPSAKINGRDLFEMINGHDQIPAFLNLIHTSRHFRVLVIGIS
jgi:hypothetical protein